MEATPVAPYGIARVELPAGLSPLDLADRLALLPDEIAGMARQPAQTSGDSATVVFIVGQETATPRFAVVVALIVPAREDADAALDELRVARWGEASLHQMTASGSGSAEAPAFREFWRTFPPGLFALPNQPVYFLLFYQAGSEYAFMVIAGEAAARAAVSEALAETLGVDAN